MLYNKKKKEKYMGIEVYIGTGILILLFGIVCKAVYKEICSKECLDCDQDGNIKK
jgi:hypothetical protein